MTALSHFSVLSDAISQSGFALRGGFHSAAGDGVPQGVASVVLIGNIGSLGFKQFQRSPEWRAGADPLDRYTERLVGDIAQRFCANVVFPWQGPPWWPFQRWAQRAEAVSISPLRILIHPRHGLWHAYRAALFFDSAVTGLPTNQHDRSVAVESQSGGTSSPCSQCRARPCLTACPVNAFGEDGFDGDRCARHLNTPAGQECLNEGCAARNACPQGTQERYAREHQQFHMRAFVGAQVNSI
ncbi:MAG: hypothetical protein ACI9DC_002473 [Gammaproteobacteria bacterium]|jgi:hypothetical protein